MATKHWAFIFYEGKGIPMAPGQVAPEQCQASVTEGHTRPSGHCRNTPAHSSSSSTSVTLQSLEALERDSGGSSHELQEPGPPLLVEGLHRLPEPPDDVAVGHAVLQPGVGLPVTHVYFIQATNYQL